MKKTVSILTLALMLGVSGAAVAKCDCKDCGKNLMGGYVDSADQKNMTISTVQSVAGLKDGDMVTLEGKITKRIKKDKYIFADKTGNIRVEIDKKVWRGQNVTPDDMIMITGEIDKDDDRTTIDVERLLKKNNTNTPETTNNTAE